MMTKLSGLLLLMTVVFAACSSGYGNKVTGGNLTVFFADPENEKEAGMLAEYWRKKDLIGNQKQYIRLLEDEQRYHVYLIANEPKDIGSLPARERQLLIGLQAELNDSLFTEKHCTLYISDHRFKPILKVNDL